LTAENLARRQQLIVLVNDCHAANLQAYRLLG
jgi:hypothetical protein